MKADSVSAKPNNRNKSFINAKTTGYVATAGVGLSILSGITKNKFLRKNHKTFAGISVLGIISHILIVSGKHRQKKNDKNLNKLSYDV